MYSTEFNTGTTVNVITLINVITSRSVYHIEQVKKKKMSHTVVCVYTSMWCGHISMCACEGDCMMCMSLSVFVIAGGWWFVHRIKGRQSKH